MIQMTKTILEDQTAKATRAQLRRNSMTKATLPPAVVHRRDQIKVLLQRNSKGVPGAHHYLSLIFWMTLQKLFKRE
jgi:hypothetical protein